MEKIIIISDFIEGQSVVASVRYEDLMPYINKHYETIVINKEMYGSFKSEYAQSNYKFKTIKSKYTQSLNDKEISKPNSKFERILRNKLILSIWRNFSNSKFKFNKLNKTLFNELNKVMQNNDVYAIFLTVPDIHGLYIMEYLKRKYNVPVVVEVRDILNNNIGKGNPRFIMKKAERILITRADGIIALTKGIQEHYRKLNANKKMTVITNGYNPMDFEGCEYNPINGKAEIRLAHVGSIYKGRNLKDFIAALIKISKKNNIKIELDIVGYLDSEASEDIKEIRAELQETTVIVNILGTLPHKEAIKYLKQCDISVILTHKIGSEYAIPGKVFEYIGACKPIIAVTKDKDLVKLIDGKYGECAEHSVEHIEAKILKLIKTEYNFEDKLKFSRESQGNNILNFIEEVVKEKEKYMQ
jgi:glycosyltransferase involved in cell wall biosynthesis